MINFILILFGVYCVGGGAALLLNPDRMRRMIKNFEDMPALSYLTGAIMAPLGAGLFLYAYEFSNPKQSLVGLLGIALLIEGLLFMVAPRTILSLAKPLMGEGVPMRLFGVLALAIAGVFLWLGHT